MANQAKDLFQLQAELIDLKVDIAMSKSIDRIINKIEELEHKMNIRFNAIDHRFNSVENRITAIDRRLVAVETKVGMVNETQKQIRSQFIDYSFKAGWLLIGAALSWIAIHFHV